ncbi:MAG: sigma-70 family RNA polymerase sigma factor [Gemmatimonadota bacterium]
MPSPTGSAVTDGDLIRRAAARDESAIGTLYDRYGQVVYAVAFRVVGQRADAEEIVMEAFAQVWRDAERFEVGRGSCVAWLTMIARSRALDFVRSQQRRTRITTAAGQDDPDSGPAMSNWRSSPSDAVEQSERKQKVEAALGNLSEPQRRAIELAYFEGLSQSEIAERLQEPLGTVKTRVRLGMQKLRDALRPYYAGGGG